MFFDGRSSKEGRRQRTINNSELTFIIYSSKAFWHKSGGGVDGVDFEDASASPRRSSSFDSAKSAERNKDGRPLHLFFFQQPVRDNFPNWIRFKFDASFWLAAIETTDENCNPLPPPTSLPATAPTAPTATIRQSMPLDWINWIENSLAMGFCDDLDSFD